MYDFDKDSKILSWNTDVFINVSGVILNTGDKEFMPKHNKK